MYPKAGNMLHSIRHSIGDDKLFRDILRGMNATFYHQTVTTRQVEDFISQKAGWDYTKVFDQCARFAIAPFLTWSTAVGLIDIREHYSETLRRRRHVTAARHEESHVRDVAADRAK